MQVPLLDRPADVELTRSARTRRLPARFQDHVPTSTTPTQMGRPFLTKKRQLEAMRARVATAQPEPELESATGEWSDEDDQAGSEATQGHITTEPNSFGVFRKYLSASTSHNPSDANPFSDIPSARSRPAAPHPTTAEPIGSDLAASTDDKPDPLSSSTNPTRDLLLGWWSTEGSSEGIRSLTSLVDCIKHPLFDASQLQDFNPASALRQFEQTSVYSTSGPKLTHGDSWKIGSVEIKVPCQGVKQSEKEAPVFTVEGVLYRDAVSVIANELADPDSFEDLHIKPFEEWWKPGEGDDPIRVYSEVYTSDAMLEAERDLQEKLKTIPGPQLETFIVAMLLYSDSTHLTSFGFAALWPMYLFIGNLSKYTRAKPTSFSAHHLAYLPTVRG